MDIKKLLVSLAGAGMVMSANAETGVKSNTKFGTGEDSVRCVASVSTFQNMAKQKSYKGLHEFWQVVFNECPASTQRIYSDGNFMLKWEIEQETDINKKKALFKDMMDLHDGRIKYFGNVKKYPTYYILGRKAFDYITYINLTNDPTKSKAYTWLGEAIEKGGSKNEPQVFQQFFQISCDLYKNNNDAYRQQLISDYMKITPLINEGLESDSTFAPVKAFVDRQFVLSGVAECSTLDKAYAAQIESNKNNKEFLNDVLKLYRIADCKESKVYFKGSGYLHAIEPTAASACGMAAQATSNKNYSQAINYYQEAVKLESDRSAKSMYYLYIASLYSTQGNYQAARTNAQNAIANNPNNGKAYMIIGQLYAAHRDISDDKTIQATAYWAAVDKLEKAKSVDPSLASQCNSMINQYKQYFPDKSELFMRGIKGGSYTVPGWINESTTVR